MQGRRRPSGEINQAIEREARLFERAADRYASAGDAVTARRLRQHAVELRASGEAHERRQSLRRPWAESPIASRLAPPVPVDSRPDLTPHLRDAYTDAIIRPATPFEWSRSRHAILEDGEPGIFDVDGRACWVDGGAPEVPPTTPNQQG